MRVVIETGWAVKMIPAGPRWPYWLKTASGTTNKKQIKVYSSPVYAKKAALYYPLEVGDTYEIHPIEVSVEIPDGPAPF